MISLEGLDAAFPVLLSILAPSDALLTSGCSRALQNAICCNSLAAATSQRSDGKWHLVSYISYAEPLDVDFAFILFLRGSPHSSVGREEFGGFALGAALERAGRLQHRPFRWRAARRIAVMLLSQGAPPTAKHKVGNLGSVWRPLLDIPISHGDVANVELLLRARADASQSDTQGEPVVCRMMQNVLAGGEGARDIFGLLLASLRPEDLPTALRTKARASLRASLAFSLSHRDDANDDKPSSYWWLGGRGTRLCRRIFVEVEHAAAGVPHAPRRGSGHRPGVLPWRRRLARRRPRITASDEKACDGVEQETVSDEDNAEHQGGHG